jgi:hypothetical protein
MACPRGAPQVALYWLACLGLKVGFHLSYSATTWKAYPSWTVLSCTPGCLHVFEPTSQVGQGPRTGRARLSGTVETLVGGDPWVPMSHKPPINV